ncbi:MAG: hypothetical protein ACRCUS_07995 [Anaerovoracaceae bacterium]
MNLPIIVVALITINSKSLSQIQENIPSKLSKIQGKWVTENDDGTLAYDNIVGSKSYFPNIVYPEKLDSAYNTFCDDCAGIERSSYDISKLKINNDNGEYLMIDSLFCYEFYMPEDGLSYSLNWTYRHIDRIIYKRVNAMHPDAKRGIIKAEKSIIYTLPNKEKPMKKYLVRYDEIEILERQEGFTKIKFYGKPDIIGWIQTEDIWK